jgi:hypothetical protein
MGEIERRKFTVEEGDHLTLLNGERLCYSLSIFHLFRSTAYNAFVKSMKGFHITRSRPVNPDFCSQMVVNHQNGPTSTG